MNIEKELRKGRKLQTTRHLGLSVAVISILYGVFIVVYEGYFAGLLHPYTVMVYEEFIGGILVLVGLLKIIGVVMEIPFLKWSMIYMLSFCWGGLLGVSFFYSFGVGYPNPMPIFFGKIVWDCWKVASRGDFS